MSVYWDRSDPFEFPVLELLGRVVWLIPALYKTISDRTGFTLVKTVDSILDRTTPQTGDQLFSVDSKGSVLHDVCREVASSLGCLETSIYLENRIEEPGVFRRRGTTLPAEQAGPETYAPKATDGLTGWVLERGHPVQIFDLATYDKDRVRIEREYPGLQWKNHLGIEQVARSLRAIQRKAVRH